MIKTRCNVRDELQELRFELDALGAELLESHRAIRRLRRRRGLDRHWTAILSASALIALSLASWTAFAQKDSALSHALRAPLKVVDKNKKTIFIVSEGSKELPRGVYLIDAAGKPVVRVYDFGGGHFKVTADTNDKDTAVMASGMTGLGLSLMDDKPRVFIGEDRTAVGETPEATDHGAVSVFSAIRDHASAALTVTDHRGTAAVYNAAGTAIAALTESDKYPRSGRVKISTAKQDGVFSAGGTPEGGVACRSRGKALECLGPDLPLSIHKTKKSQ
jgi:hypothetical protein